MRGIAVANSRLLALALRASASTTRAVVSSVPRARCAVSVVPAVVAQRRPLSSSVAADHSHDGHVHGEANEASVAQLLKNFFGDDATIIVTDTSGGCGAFFRISVTSKRFENTPLVKQHQMVNQALSSIISTIHGITIQTKKPTSS